MTEDTKPELEILETHPDGRAAKTRRTITLGERPWSIIEVYDADGRLEEIQQSKPDGKPYRTIFCEEGKASGVTLYFGDEPKAALILLLRPDGLYQSLSQMYSDTPTPQPLRVYFFNHDKGEAQIVEYTRGGKLRSERTVKQADLIEEKNMERQLLFSLGACGMPVPGSNLYLMEGPFGSVKDLFPNGNLRRFEVAMEKETQILRYLPDGRDFTDTTITDDAIHTELVRAENHTLTHAIVVRHKDGKYKLIQTFTPKGSLEYKIEFINDQEMYVERFAKKRLSAIISQSFFGKEVRHKDVPDFFRPNDTQIIFDLQPVKKLVDSMLTDYPVIDQVQTSLYEKPSIKAAPAAPVEKLAPASVAYDIEELAPVERKTKGGGWRVTHRRTVNGVEQNFLDETFRADGTLQTATELEPNGSGKETYYYAGCKKSEEKPRTVFRFSSMHANKSETRLYLGDEHDRDSFEILMATHADNKRPLMLDFADINEATSDVLETIKVAHAALQVEGKGRQLLLTGIKSKEPQLRAHLEGVLRPLIAELGTESIKIGEAKHDGNLELPSYVLTERIDYAPAGNLKPVYMETFDSNGDMVNAYVFNKGAKQRTNDFQRFSAADVNVKDAMAPKR